MEEISFPIKTKIAAWWITIIGGICLISTIWLFIKIPPDSRVPGTPNFFWFCVFLTPLVLGTIGFLFPGTMILYLKIKLGWWLAIIPLSIWTIVIVIWGILYVINNLGSLSVVSLLGFTLLITFVVIIPLILLLLDRKNFWKIAS